jgi:hypothetical protein
MSLQHALHAIQRIESDTEWRLSCNSIQSRADLLDRFCSEGYDCTELEMENAFNYLLLRCQTEEQAGRIQALQGWFSIFR